MCAIKSYESPRIEISIQLNSWKASQAGMMLPALSISTHPLVSPSISPMSLTEPNARSHPRPTAESLHILEL